MSLSHPYSYTQVCILMHRRCVYAGEMGHHDVLAAVAEGVTVILTEHTNRYLTRILHLCNIPIHAYVTEL